MDSPIFLYAESLGASATVMGLIAGMTPLMVIFQIPAAAHVGRWGYKVFIATGWSLRLVFAFGLVFVPLLDGVINQQSQLALVLVLLFAFNVVRGIASCAWYPWIRGLIPENIRGRYLTFEGAFVNAGSLVAFLLDVQVTEPLVDLAGVDHAHLERVAGSQRSARQDMHQVLLAVVFQRLTCNGQIA